MRMVIVVRMRKMMRRRLQRVMKGGRARRMMMTMTMRTVSMMRIVIRGTETLMWEVEVGLWLRLMITGNIMKLFWSVRIVTDAGLILIPYQVLVVVNWNWVHMRSVI
jgi:hypothetical protein